jgi:hypothetical protein
LIFPSLSVAAAGEEMVERIAHTCLATLAYIGDLHHLIIITFKILNGELHTLSGRGFSKKIHYHTVLVAATRVASIIDVGATCVQIKHEK